MRFGLIAIVLCVAGCEELSKEGAELPEPNRDSAIEACPRENIIVLDRSTVLDARSLTLFERGIDAFLSDEVTRGKIGAWEVRDTTLGYEELLSSENLPSEPPDIEPPELVNCDQNPGETYPNASNEIRIKECEQNNQDVIDKHKKDKNIAEQQGQMRSIKAAEIKESIMQFAKTPRPTAKRTAISGPIFHLLEARCKNSLCSVAIFSDLVDSHILAELKSQVGHDTSMYEEKGKQVANNLKDEYGTTVRSDTAILVWGVGRSDDGGELSEAKTKALRVYWNSFFQTIGIDAGKNVHLYFEYPSDLASTKFPADRSKCGKRLDPVPKNIAIRGMENLNWAWERVLKGLSTFLENSDQEEQIR